MEEKGNVTQINPTIGNIGHRNWTKQQYSASCKIQFRERERERFFYSTLLSNTCQCTSSSIACIWSKILNLDIISFAIVLHKSLEEWLWMDFELFGALEVTLTAIVCPS